MRRREWTTRLLEEPVVAGVESMAGGVVTVRIIAKCAPNENFPVSREIRERVKAAFDAPGSVLLPVQAPGSDGGEQGGQGVAWRAPEAERLVRDH